jgi:hypothetical protein
MRQVKNWKLKLNMGKKEEFYDFIKTDFRRLFDKENIRTTNGLCYSYLSATTKELKKA